jgi:AcrR family transcriptional regulator
VVNLSRIQIKRQQTIEQILQIGREEMQANGVAALSLGTIARRMHMKTPSLYNYFDSKDAIYDELFRRGYQLALEIANKRRALGGTAAERIDRGIRDYMTFAQENPDLYQLMYQRPVPGFVPSEESYAIALELLTTAQAEIKELLSMDELQINLPPEEALDLFIALMHGLTEMHLANNPELPVGQGRYGKLIPAAVQLLLDAWGKQGD